MEFTMPVEYTIRLSKLISGDDSPHDNQWLVSYTPTPFGAPLQFESTNNIDQAKKFPSRFDAWMYWMMPNGVRPNGAVNRPLTVWTVLIEEATKVG